MLRSSLSCCARILLAVICSTSVLTIAIGGVEAGEIAADRLFNPNHLLNVEIEILEEDWKKLCRQTRGRGGFATLFSNTTEKPFTYFKGDIKIDGVKIPAVGISKRYNLLRLFIVFNFN